MQEDYVLLESDGTDYEEEEVPVRRSRERTSRRVKSNRGRSHAVHQTLSEIEDMSPRRSRRRQYEEDYDLEDDYDDEPEEVVVVKRPRRPKRRPKVRREYEDEDYDEPKSEPEPFRNLPESKQTQNSLKSFLIKNIHYGALGSVASIALFMSFPGFSGMAESMSEIRATVLLLFAFVAATILMYNTNPEKNDDNTPGMDLLMKGALVFISSLVITLFLFDIMGQINYSAFGLVFKQLSLMTVTSVFIGGFVKQVAKD